MLAINLPVKRLRTACLVLCLPLVAGANRATGTVPSTAANAGFGKEVARALEELRNDGRPQDLAALARGFADQSAVPAGSAGLLIFVSFSLPAPTMERLIVQAERAQAPLVLRGLDGDSLTKTAVRIRQLLGQRNVAFQIDPTAFERYRIDRVPAYVLVRASEPGCGTGACKAGDGHLVTMGDVSLDFALEHAMRERPDYAPLARRYLARLEPRP